MPGMSMSSMSTVWVCVYLSRLVRSLTCWPGDSCRWAWSKCATKGSAMALRTISLEHVPAAVGVEADCAERVDAVDAPPAEVTDAGWNELEDAEARMARVAPLDAPPVTA